jgi:NSS family neurotransmitter:Na+ symporter
MTEKFAVSRKVAAWAIGVPVWLLGIAVCLSFNHWADVKIFGLSIFDLLDTLTTQFLMPLSGLLIAVFVGWVMHKSHVRDEIALSGGSYRLWLNVVRFVSPIAITVIFLHVTGVIK